MVVQPSRYESGIGAPVEAILCGTPVIVSKGTGSGEDLARMDGGYLVEFGDCASMVSIIDSVLRDPSVALFKTERAKQYVLAHLSMAAKVEEYEALYQSCLGRAR